MLNLQKPQRILLIEPPFYRLFGYERWHYPITLTLLGTYLEELGHDVKVYDADKPSSNCKSLNRSEVREKYHLYGQALQDSNHYIWEEIRNTIQEYEPDIIGMTSITAKIDAANIIAKMAKQLYGDKVKIILGGSHVQGMLATYPNYNFGAEYDDLVTHIPGLVDRKPNKKLLINAHEYSSRNLSSLLTSSGCPNSCTFCCHSYDKKVVYRNVESIRQEISEIKTDFPELSEVYLLDDCLFSNYKHFRNICNIFAEFGINFTAGSRIMALSQEKIAEFIKCGGTRIYVGVESGSQQILDRVKKNLKIEEIKRRTKWLNDAGIPWSAFFVVGFPFETLEDLKKTKELICEIKPSFVSLNRFTPYPGTEIYNEYYADKDLDNKEIFQLNSSSSVKLSEDEEEYVDYLFTFIDEYNRCKSC